ncbi:hypothetical protein FRC17_011149 [Serendipita sp. 399]|nr:hypothetical protein FRC17_011149 [Serendipita sp. 399]
MDPPLDASPAISTTIHNAFNPVNTHPPPLKRQKVTNDGDDSIVAPSGRKGKGRKKAPVSSEPLSHLTLAIPEDRLENGEEPPFQSAIAENAGEKLHHSPSKDSQADGSIRCICGTHWDDGQMVQCDECQTWQHTRCYRVDFNKLTEDALWVCVICDEPKWRNMTLDPDWANRTQKSLQEKERFAQYAKQLEERASRGGASRRGRTGRRTAAVILDTSSALVSSRRVFEGPNHDVQDDPETWRKVYVPVHYNVVEDSLLPKIRQYLSHWGPSSRYSVNASKGNRGWATPVPPKDPSQIGPYDISSRSMPIVVTPDELVAAEEEVWVTVRARHCPRPEDTAISRPKTPSTQRPVPSASLQVDEVFTPAPTPRTADNSYRNIFLQATANPQAVQQVQVQSQQTVSLSTETPAQLQPSRSTVSPGPENRKGTASPITNRGRKTTPHLPDLVNGTSTPKVRTDGISTVDPYTPQQYTLHARQETPARTLLALYPANIVSHETYLNISSNQYLRLGTPKTHVKMFPPPLDVVLDARIVGGIGRFARSGCWPNSALRGVVISHDKAKRSLRKATGEDSQSEVGVKDGFAALAFGIFSLRRLEEGEEIILAWEWDDAHRIHRLPRLLVEEARALLHPSPLEKSVNDSQFFMQLSQSFTDAFGTCACMEQSLPDEKQLQEPSGRCAIEELMRWAERQKHASSNLPTRPGTPERPDDEQTEPDEAIGPSSVDIRISQSQQVSISTPLRSSHPPVDSPAPWANPHPASGPHRNSRNPASLGFITQPNTLSTSSVHRSLTVQRPVPQLSLFHSANSPTIASPIPRSTDAILPHDTFRSSSVITPHRTPGSASIASILNQVDTHPLSRPTSRSAPGIIRVRTSDPSSQNNHPKDNPLHRIWGRSPTTAELVARDGELDEDVLKRVLGVNLGPLIGLSRGVRYEDARGLGGPVLRGVPNLSKTVINIHSSSNKRKRDILEEEEQGKDEEIPVKRQKLEAPIPPPFARQRKRSNRPVVKIHTDTMDIDQSSGVDFSFTFAVPVADAAPSASHGHQSGDAVMREQPDPVSPVRLSSHEHEHRDQRISSPDITSSNIIQTTVIIPLPAIESVQTPVEQNASSSDNPPDPKTPSSVVQEDLSPPGRTRSMSIVVEEPNSSDIPVTTAAASHDTASDLEIPTPPALQTHFPVVGSPSEPTSGQVDHPLLVEPHVSLSPESNLQSKTQESRIDRPITPIPMVLQANLMTRSWHSPSPNTVHDDGPSDTVPLSSISPRDSPKPKRESIGSVERILDHTTAARPETPSPPPLLIKGRRLVTPPSRDMTPTPSPTQQHRQAGSVKKETDSNEDDDSSSLSDDDEDDDMQSKSSSNDSDSLTPAPSPTPLPVEIDSTPDLPERTASPTPSHVERLLISTTHEDQSLSPRVTAATESPPAVVSVEQGDLTTDSLGETKAPVTDHLLAVDEASSVQKEPSPPITEKGQEEEPAHEASTSAQQPVLQGESPSASTAHIRRRTLQGYASRRRKDPLISPSIQSTQPLSLLNPPSSPSSRPSTNLGDDHKPDEPPSKREFTSYGLYGSPIQDSAIDRGLSNLAPAAPISDSTPLSKTTKGDNNHLPEQYVHGNLHDKGTADETAPALRGPLTHQRRSSDTKSHLSVSGTPEWVSPFSSFANRPRTPTSPRRRTLSSESSLSPQLPSLSDRMASSTRSPEPLKTMEDGEIDVSSGSSPPKRVGSRSPSTHRSHSKTASIWLDNPHTNPANHASPVTPQLPNGRANHADVNTASSDPLATSSIASTSRPAVNGAARPPTGPRSNLPPPSGPRALRGLDPRALSRSVEKPRPWERDRPRDRDQDRERERERSRDRDWDRDRDPEHRYWNRPRGSYRPRGK